jgi:hypothetical protein
MDTFKDRQQLEEILARGTAPWEVWNATTDTRAQSDGKAVSIHGPRASVRAGLSGNPLPTEEGLGVLGG